MTRRFVPLVALMSCAVMLGACGHRPGERAVSGGLIGAGTGAALVAVTGGGSLLAGAVVGGAVGAAAGGLTSPHTVDLGRPVWR